VVRDGRRTAAAETAIWWSVKIEAISCGVEMYATRRPREDACVEVVAGKARPTTVTNSAGTSRDGHVDRWEISIQQSGW
jgi:hypothetical protein